MPTHADDRSTHVFLKVGVSAKNAEAFRSLMAELVSVAEAEPGTLIYEWWLTEDGAIYHVHERYRDQPSGDAHVRNFVETYAERFFGLISSIEAYVYGAPSDYVRGALAGASPTYLVRAAGFSRF